MFSIKQSIRFGWEKVKEHFWFVIGTTLVYSIFNFSLNIGGRRGDGEREVAEAMPEINSTFIMLVIGAVLLAIAFAVVSTIVQIGYTRIYLKLHDGGERPQFKELFTDFKPFWRYVGASILLGLRILLGFVLLIVPGVIWAIKFGFAPMIVVDKHVRATEAMRESARITEGHKMHLFKLALVLGALNILGFIAFGIGVLISIPVSTLAYIYVYRRLSGSEMSVDPTISGSDVQVPVSEPTITA